MLAHVLCRGDLFPVVLTPVDEHQETLDGREEAGLDHRVTDLTVFLAIQDGIAVSETLLQLVYGRRRKKKRITVFMLKKSMI